MVSKLIITAIAISVASASGVIKSALRSVQMLEPDVTIYTNDIKFEANEDPGRRVTFDYLVAADYESNLVELECRNLNYYDQVLDIERVNKGNSSDILWFQVDVTDLLKESKNGIIDLEFKEYYKLRREPFPKSLPIT